MNPIDPKTSCHFEAQEDPWDRVATQDVPKTEEDVLVKILNVLERINQDLLTIRHCIEKSTKRERNPSDRQ